MKRAVALMKRHEYGRIIQIVGNLWKEPGEQMFTNSMMNAAIINASKMQPHSLRRLVLR